MRNNFQQHQIARTNVEMVHERTQQEILRYLCLYKKKSKKEFKVIYVRLIYSNIYFYGSKKKRKTKLWKKHTYLEMKLNHHVINPLPLKFYLQDHVMLLKIKNKNKKKEYICKI